MELLDYKCSLNKKVIRMIYLLTLFFAVPLKGYCQSLNPTAKLSLDAKVFENVDKFRSGEHFEEIEEGEVVEVLDVQSPYILIRYNEIIGIIGYGRVDPSSYDQNLSPIEIDYPHDITLTTDQILVVEPSKISDRIIVVKSGSEIKLISKQKDFYEIEYNGKVGYIHESVYQNEYDNPIAEIHNEHTYKKSNLVNSFQSGDYRTETYKVGSSYYTITYKNGKVIDRSTYSTFFK